MTTGSVEWFDKNKGYGFISTPDSQSLFVHYTDLAAVEGRCLRKGQTVAFDIPPTGGRALNVKLIMQPRRET